MKTKIYLSLLATALMGCASHSDSKPQVLLIGDSISRGYSSFVQSKLADEYAVATIPDPYEPPNILNARNTWHTLLWIDYMTSHCKKCSVIVWNNGIWNVSRQDVSNLESDPRHYYTTVEQYKSELAQIAVKLKATGARVIFMTSTRLPPSTAYFFDLGKEVTLNEAAKEVLPPLGVEVYDLYHISNQFPLSMHDAPGSPHWNEDANNQLGDFVAGAIRGGGP